MKRQTPNMIRVTCASIALLGMCLGFPFKHEKVPSACHAHDNQKASPSRRALCFPSDQSVGVLRVGRLKGPSVVVDFEVDFEQITVFAAKGNIEVSEEDFLELQVGSVDDLEFLEQLSPGALQGLTITGLEINRNALALITRLEGLKCLKLNRCEFKKDTFEDAKSLSSLRAISVFSTTLDGLAFAGQNQNLENVVLAGAISRAVVAEFASFRSYPQLPFGAANSTQSIALICNLNSHPLAASVSLGNSVKAPAACGSLTSAQRKLPNKAIEQSTFHAIRDT